MIDGWIAVAKKSEYDHCFGGDAWALNDVDRIGTGPHLLLNLDLNDPRLRFLETNGISAIPVCSYINFDLWIYPQTYTFEPLSSEITYIKHEMKYHSALTGDLAYPQPIRRSPIDLREMTPSELAVTGEAYWDASDEFLGGSSFIRIGGPPLWLQNEEKVFCECGTQSRYFCAIGYEFLDDYGITGDRPFFIGEAALYFFICSACRKVTVISQPS